VFSTHLLTRSDRNYHKFWRGALESVSNCRHWLVFDLTDEILHTPNAATPVANNNFQEEELWRTRRISKI